MKLPKNEEEPNKVKLPKESNYITISVVSGPETVEKFKVKKNEALLDVMMSVSFDIIISQFRIRI
ncbi:uncharacterized protein isoform X3 [Rhodnius prolixus]|uniref:uncharacterized protein isoform X3 n=1 Tax=Rhodnius prolixus TaxID=13249 RepID=UPI003D18D22A